MFMLWNYILASEYQGITLWSHSWALRKSLCLFKKLNEDVCVLVLNYVWEIEKMLKILFTINCNVNSINCPLRELHYFSKFPLELPVHQSLFSSSGFPLSSISKYFICFGRRWCLWDIRVMTFLLVASVSLNVSALGNISYPQLSEMCLKNLLLFCLHKISVLHLLIAAENIVELITFLRENIFLLKLEVTFPDRDMQKK